MTMCAHCPEYQCCGNVSSFISSWRYLGRIEFQLLNCNIQFWTVYWLSLSSKDLSVVANRNGTCKIVLWRRYLWKVRSWFRVGIFKSCIGSLRSKNIFYHYTHQHMEHIVTFIWNMDCPWTILIPWYIFSDKAHRSKPVLRCPMDYWESTIKL